MIVEVETAVRETFEVEISGGRRARTFRRVNELLPGRVGRCRARI